MEINYFKKFIEVYMKFVIYKNILKNYQVWENNENITDILDDFILEENKFKKFN